MSRIEFCQACQNERTGRKTRIPFEHTCERGIVEHTKFFGESSAISTEKAKEAKTKNEKGN